jgi:hypothetical protein
MHVESTHHCCCCGLERGPHELDADGYCVRCEGERHGYADGDQRARELMVEAIAREANPTGTDENAARLIAAALDGVAVTMPSGRGFRAQVEEWAGELRGWADRGDPPSMFGDALAVEVEGWLRAGAPPKDGPDDDDRSDADNGGLR